VLLPASSVWDKTMNVLDSCLEAHYYAHDVWLRIVHVLLVLLSITLLAMAFILCRKLCHTTVPVHANLKVVPARVFPRQYPDSYKLSPNSNMPNSFR
jgi:hypothetical protein